jgi:hypothetical protein
MFVICLSPVPSLFISQISTAPDRVDANAICSEPPIGVGGRVWVIVGDRDGLGVKVGDKVSDGDGVDDGVGVLDSIASMDILVFVGTAVVNVGVRYIPGMA